MKINSCCQFMFLPSAQRLSIQFLKLRETPKSTVNFFSVVKFKRFFLPPTPLLKFKILYKNAKTAYSWKWNWWLMKCKHLSCEIGEEWTVNIIVKLVKSEMQIHYFEIGEEWNVNTLLWNWWIMKCKLLIVKLVNTEM